MLLSTSELLEKAYRCALEPQLWTGVLDDICSGTSARSAVIQHVDRKGERMRTKWLAGDSVTIAAMDRYRRFVGDDSNPRMLACSSPPRAGVTLARDRELLPERSARTADFKAGLESIGLGGFLGARIELGADETLLFALHRDGGDRRDFDRDTEALIEMLLPHFAQALRLAREIDGAHHRAAMLESTFDHLNHGVILCDADSRVEMHNRSAEKLITSTGALSIKRGYVHVQSRGDAVRLRELIQGAVSGEAACMAIGNQLTDLVQVFAVPVGGCARPACSEGAHARVALLLSAHTAQPILPAKMVEDIFGLTPTEAGLATAISAGASLRDYAEERGVSVFTARFQLKQILTKTGARRQSDLVRLLISSAVTMVLDQDDMFLGAAAMSHVRHCRSLGPRGTSLVGIN